MSSSYAQPIDHTSNQQQDKSNTQNKIPNPSESIQSSIKNEIIFPQQTTIKDQETLQEIIIDSITQQNDLTVLSSQISPEEIVTNSDISTTNEIIEQSRVLEAQEQNLKKWGYFLDILKKSSINIILPFINGLMLGFGEILAHEIGFKYNWIGAKVEPARRLQQRRIDLDQQHEKVRVNGARFL
ncbi:hypothetical protein KGF54_000104 [Candida jiufengensis]|uniref:uncharacterized protein n=1 Tax=Candida jiufengensis TaxID=497108 RepID=UPI0022240C40|nr:uncharacterized protein KGF54_000104 [Candida jiufengensis]KAI5957176.1 hypothetical protein KGF54_000104 [Candida jiufengensis]